MKGTAVTKSVTATLILISLVIGSFVVLRTAAANPASWRAEGWRTDFTQTTVAFSEILSGGPPRDGIPPIDDPQFSPVRMIDVLDEREPVIRLEVAGVVRFYPLRIMTWHEIVNDTIAGRPVAVTYCPLCNASIVFDRRLDDAVLDFGTTGLLRKSDLVMYDRQTESWWQQFTGEAIVGRFAGRHLAMIPSSVIAWKEAKASNPEAEVLIPPNPLLRPYGNNPYVGYDRRTEPYPLFLGDLPEGIDPMARVVIVRRGSGERAPVVKAVLLSHLRKVGSIRTDHLILSWQPGVASALDTAAIRSGRDVGAVEARDAETGAELVHDTTFAFVLFAFHPDVPIETEKGELRLEPKQ
jgi:hypothetical protein